MPRWTKSKDGQSRMTVLIRARLDHNEHRAIMLSIRDGAYPERIKTINDALEYEVYNLMFGIAKEREQIDRIEAKKNPVDSLSPV